MIRIATTVKSILIIAGTVGCLVGLAVLIAPVQFESSAGIAIGNDPALINELRATGGGLVGVGIAILAGAFAAHLARPAAMLAAMVYLGYGLARVLSIAIDGAAGQPLVLITVLEIAIGLSCLVAFRKLANRKR